MDDVDVAVGAFGFGSFVEQVSFDAHDESFEPTA